MKIIYFSLIVVSVVLAILPHVYGKKNTVSNTVYSLCAVFFGIWVFSVYRTYYFPTVIWPRLAFFAIILELYFQVLFLFVYPKVRAIWHSRYLKLISLVPVSFAVLGLVTSFIVQGIDVNLVTSYGLGHKVFTLYVVIVLSAIIYFNVLGFREYKPVDKMRLQYYWIGFFVFAVFTLITNLILPLRGTNAYSHLGPLWFSIFLAANFYTIIRHQLLDIRIIVKKSIFYFSLIAFLSLLLVTTVLQASVVVDGALNMDQLFLMLAAVALIVLIYPHFLGFIDGVTESLFFRTKYNFEDSIRSYETKLTYQRDVSTILETLESTIQSTIKPTTYNVYLKEQGLLIAQNSVEYPFSYRMDESHPIVKFFIKYPDVCLSEQLPFTYQSDPLWADIWPMLQDMNVELVLPVIDNDDILALVFMGPRLSDAIYSKEDFRLLKTFASRSSIAIKNALQYELLTVYIDTLSKLNMLSVESSDLFDAPVFIEKSADLLKEMFQCEMVLFYLDPEEAPIICACAEDDQQKEFFREFPVKSFLEKCCRSKIELGIHSVQEYISYSGAFTTFYQSYGYQTIITLPIEHAQKKKGIVIGFSKEWMKNTSIAMPLLEIFSRSFSSLINNKQLYSDIKYVKEYNESILENMEAGIVVCDDSNIVTHYNKQVEHILGYAKEDVVGYPLQSLEKGEGLMTLVSDTTEEHRFLNIEMNMGSDNERVFSLSTGIVPEKDKWNTMVVMSDVTEFKMLERNVEQSNRLTALGNMALGIAHEINQPVMSIQSFLERLHKKWDDPAFRGQYVKSVCEEVDKINLFCQSLLRLGKPKAIQFTKVNLKRVFDEVRVLASGELKMYNAEFTAECPDDCMLEADYAQLVQVLFNIVLNACQAIHKTGGYINITAKIVNSNIQIDVTDNGKGMSDKTKQLLFDPFYTTKSNRVGLGLTIVHRIIQDHGGTLDIRSIRGKGTTLSIKLPRRQEPVGVTRI